MKRFFWGCCKISDRKEKHIRPWELHRRVVLHFLNNPSLRSPRLCEMRPAPPRATLRGLYLLSVSLQSIPECRVTPPGVGAANGQPQRIPASDDHHEFLASRDRRVQQVPLQEHVVLRMQRQDDARVFAPLALVHGEGVRECQFIECLELVIDGPIFIVDGEDLVDAVEFHDDALVAIEDVPVVVVFELDHTVSHGESPSEAFNPRLLGLRIDGGLKFAVELMSPQTRAVHRHQDLDITARIEPESTRDTMCHEFADQIGDLIGLIGSNEIKVGKTRIRMFQWRLMAGVDGVSGGDDATLLRLTEDGRQAYDGNRLRRNEVGQDASRADRRKLVDVADEDEAGVRGDGSQERSGQADIEHRGFVEDEKVSLQWVLGTSAKTAILRGELQKSVDCLRRAAGRFLESFGGTTCGSRQNTRLAFGREDLDDAAHDRRLSDAGAPRDDEHLLRDGLAYRFDLLIGECNAEPFLDPWKRSFDSNPLERMLRCLLQPVDLMGDRPLGSMQSRQPQGDFIVESVLDQALLFEQPFQCGFDDGLGDFGELFDLLDEDGARQSAVSVVGGLLQDMQRGGLGALNGMGIDPESLGELVGRLETDAPDIVGQSVRVFSNLFDGLVAVATIDAKRSSCADAMLIKEQHDPADVPSLFPCFFDVGKFLGADASNVKKQIGVLIEDIQELFAVESHHPLGQLGADAADGSRSEVALHSFGGGGREGLQFIGAELSAVAGIDNPASLGLELLARLYGRGFSDERHRIPPSSDMDLQYAKAGLFVIVRDSSDVALERVLVCHQRCSMGPPKRVGSGRRSPSDSSRS